MSTVFRMCGHEDYFTLELITELAAARDIRVEQVDPRPVDSRRLVFPDGTMLHLYKTGDGDGTWDQFEVFGQTGPNGIALDIWLDVLEEAGISSLSEHDDDF
jgi:hypothetical protein